MRKIEQNARQVTQLSTPKRASSAPCVHQAEAPARCTSLVCAQVPRVLRSPRTVHSFPAPLVAACTCQYLRPDLSSSACLVSLAGSGPVLDFFGPVS